MTTLFWLFTALTALIVLALLGNTALVARGYGMPVRAVRGDRAAPGEQAANGDRAAPFEHAANGDRLANDERPPISVLVPLKGAAPGLKGRLERLLAAGTRTDQFVFAMESIDDPAHAVGLAMREEHPGRDVAIAVSGPPGERMGKQHNLAAAATVAKHAVLASMDDDVELDAAHLDEGARLASGPDAGVAFAMPYYLPGASSGGALVAAYTNYGFSLHMGALALRPKPKFIVGGFWVTPRAAMDEVGGFAAFTDTVSDDSAIGRAMHEVGRVNRPLTTTVGLAPERRGLLDGARHVLKWLTLLRAEGWSVFVPVALAWHPGWFGVLAAVAGSIAGLPALLTFTPLGIAVLARIASIASLNGKAYPALAPGSYALATLAYEFVVAPWLFLVAAFRRHVVWRGRRYRIGRGGRIRDGRGT